MRQLLKNFWNGLAIILFMGFMVSVVYGTSHSEETQIMQQANLATLTR